MTVKEKYPLAHANPNGNEKYREDNFTDYSRR